VALRFSAGSVRLIVSGSLGVSGLAEPIALAVHLEDMEERLRFVARLLDGEDMSAVCREFGISRKTGYKIFDRYRQDGVEALTDRSRRPVRYANQLSDQVERLIVALKRDKPHWGARKACARA
jgi:transposase